eukprot:scaffold5993_cov30-Prasinocladus_malaysianus.AAC.1
MDVSCALPMMYTRPDHAGRHTVATVSASSCHYMLQVGEALINIPSDSKGPTINLISNCYQTSMSH